MLGNKKDELDRYEQEEGTQELLRLLKRPEPENPPKAPPDFHGKVLQKVAKLSARRNFLGVESAGDVPLRESWFSRFFGGVHAVFRHPAFAYCLVVIVSIPIIRSYHLIPTTPGEWGSAKSTTQADGGPSVIPKPPSPTEEGPDRPNGPKTEESQPPPPPEPPPSTADSASPQSKPVERPEDWGGTVPPPTPAPTTPPELVVMNVVPPPSSERTVKEGESLYFTFTAKSSTRDLVKYAWFIDEKRVPSATGDHFAYRPSFDEGGDEVVKEIRVRASCCAEQAQEQSWQVRVENVNRSPRILRTNPRAGIVTLSPDATQEFLVTTEDPDRGDEVTYVWFVDGEEVIHEKLSQFRTAFAEGKHRVEVKVSDRDGADSRQQWTVAVRPPISPPVLSRGDLSEKEARTWFDTYRGCWESLRAGRTAECLVTMGAMPRQKVTKIENYLQRRREFRVNLQDVEIHPTGPRAVISFRRIDTIDGGTFPPRRVTLEVEKQSNGRIVISKEE